MFRKTQKKGGKVVSDSSAGAAIVRAKRPRPKETLDDSPSESGAEDPKVGLAFVKPQGNIEALREKHKQRYIQAKLSDIESVLSLAPSTTQGAVDDSDPESVFLAAKRLKTENAEEFKADKINWVTGLIEVPLSLKHKLDNIEATEQAKRRLFYDNSIEESRFDDIHTEEYEHFHGQRLKAKQEAREYENIEKLMFGNSRSRRKALENKRRQNSIVEEVSQALCKDTD